MPVTTIASARRAAASAAALTVVLAAGCGSSSRPSAAAPTTAAAATAAGAATVQATLSEWKISLSRADLAPGTYTFTAVNAGHTLHALDIAGPGVGAQSTGPVVPGQSARMTVTLRAGSYQLWCPVGNHRAMGMAATIVVAGATTGAPASNGASGY